MTEPRDDELLRVLGEHYRPEPLAAERARAWLRTAERAAVQRTQTQRRAAGFAAGVALAAVAAWTLLPPAAEPETPPVLVAWADEVLSAGVPAVDEDAWVELDVPAHYQELQGWISE
jgi:hypothetical protein